MVTGGLVYEGCEHPSARDFVTSLELYNFNSEIEVLILYKEEMERRIGEG